MTYRINSNQSVLTDSMVSDIRLMLLNGKNHTEIGREVGIHRKTVYNIDHNNTWNHVPQPVRAYGYPDYLVFPDGRVYSPSTNQFLSKSIRRNGEPTVRVRTSSGKRVTTPVSTLIARGYLGSRARKPNVKYVDGNPSNSHFTNITL